VLELARGWWQLSGSNELKQRYSSNRAPCGIIPVLPLDPTAEPLAGGFPVFDRTFLVHCAETVTAHRPAAW
jgi:hypothetical protein